MNRKRKNTRPIISVLMLFGFLTILLTGLLSYALRYNTFLSSVHTIFGLFFIFAGVFHLKNNFAPMFSYFKQARVKRWACLSVFMLCLTVLGVGLGLPPFQTIIDTSYALKELKASDRQVSEVIYTRFDEEGKSLSIDIRAGEHYSGPGAVVMGVTTTGVPQMAIWLEDPEGNYIETLYVTKKASNSSYFKSLFETGERRPEALPHWSFSRGIKSADGLMMPTSDEPIADAITGATPLNNFDLRSISSTDLQHVVVKLEVNRSFDYNEFYHPDAFPDDKVYSGSGNTAQPSLIYAANIDFDSDQQYTFMRLIGHGHHSGKNGKLYQDLRGITTAKEMINRAIVEVL